MAEGGEPRLVIKLDADIEKLNEKLAKLQVVVDKATGDIKRKFTDSNHHLKKLFGEFEPEKALGNVFGKTRLGVIEEGATKIPIFGSALEALGPAGLAAAAGVGAAALAMEEAHKAIEFAKDIEDSAKKLGIGTTALQQWRLAAEETGGTAKDADAAIHGFNVALGSAQAGLGKRALKPFEALGFSKEDIKAFKSTDEALDEVIKRISALGNEAQRQAVAEKLGLTPMLGLLKLSAKQIEEMKAEFKSMGLIMDHDMIAKGSEAAHKYELLSKAIDMDLKNAFISMGPVLLWFAKQVKGIADDLDNVIEAFRKVENRSSRVLDLDLDRANKSIEVYERRKRDSDKHKGKFGWGPDPLGFLDDWGYEQAKKNRDRILKLKAEREAADKKDQGHPGTELHDVSTPKPKTNKAAEQRKHFDDEMGRLQKEQLEAAGDETHDVSQRAQISAKLVEQERRTALLKVQDEVATKAITAAQGERLKVEINTLYDLKKSKDQWASRRNIETTRDRINREMVDSEGAALTAQASIARTRQDRVSLERRALEGRMLAERQSLYHKLLFDPDVAPDDMSRQMLDLLHRQGAERDRFNRDNLNPIDAYFDKAPQSLKELNERAEDAAAQGIGDLNRGLVEAIGHGQKAGQVFRNVLQRFFLELAEQSLLATEAAAVAKGGPFSAFAHFLGFAGGGDPPVGVPSMVGEKGPELFVPKAAGTIVPNHLLAAMAGFRQSPTSVVVQHNTFQLEGSIMAADVMEQIDRKSQLAGAQAYTRAVSTFQVSAPARQASYDKLGT